MYVSEFIKESSSAVVDKTVIIGRWLAIMAHERNDRAMILSQHKLRCMQSGEIHEFMLCENRIDPSGYINHIKYLGFAEIEEGGVIEVGDHFYDAQQELKAIVIGFDETHYPNHYNIVLTGNLFLNGDEFGLQENSRFSVFKNIL